MKKTFIPLFTLFLAIALVGCAQQQAREAQKFQPETVSVAEYRDFLSALAVSIKDGVPRELNSVERRRFEEVYSSLDDMLVEVDDIDGFDQDERVRLLNLHSDLEEVVVGRSGDQIFCQRRHRVGTHFKSTECKTRAEWELDRERGQELMRQIYLSHFTPDNT